MHKGAGKVVKEKGRRDCDGHGGPVIDSVKGFDVIECSGCGFKHVMPIPSGDELKGYYADEFVPERPLYIERTEEDLEWWNAVFDERYDFLEGALSNKERRILDLGCGLGKFLSRGQDRGWQCLGIEPSKDAAAHAGGQGIEVINAPFEESGLEEGTEGFDAIHMSEVLEHIPDPARLLKSVYGLLNDGGIVCVVVPNDYSPIQEILRERLNYEPYWVAPPQHLNYFNFASLEGLLKKVGFNVVGKTAMFPMDFFLLMGDNYVGDDRLGRACHARRKRFDMLLGSSGLKGFKEEMYALMATHDVGREMVMYGKKEGR